MEPTLSESLWNDLSLRGDATAERRPPLDGERHVDVAVVGAGFTGLWTAHHLKRHDPSLRIAILERECAGFGASGRNGGWCSALFPVSDRRIDRVHGPGAGRDLRVELKREVEKVVAFCHQNGVDAVLGGELTLARTSAQRERLRAEAHGDVQWLSPIEIAARIRATAVLGGTYDPTCAALHPGDLVRALTKTVVAQGVEICESTEATAMAPRLVHTATGTVHARIVVRATEAWTQTFPGARRAVAPVYSLVIATEPLPTKVWDEIGWAGRETLHDGRNLIIYAQRTADGRIVFGGRGAPYHWGSRIAPGYDTSPRVFEALESALHDLLPPTRGSAITHRWGGPLGVPRDFFPSVSFDRATGCASAGGYVGDGVAASALAGRTLADLILARDTDRSRLAWVGHRSRRWEPEPLRWLGINAGRVLAGSIDRSERAGVLPRRRSALLSALTGG